MPPSAESPPTALSRGRPRVDRSEVLRLVDSWEAARCAPDEHAGTATLDGLDWMAATVPGTAAGALAAAGRWRPGDPLDLDGDDWWFRTTFAADGATDGEEVLLRLGGLATVAEVYLNGEPIAGAGSMWEPLSVDVGGRLRGTNDLAIRFRALAPLLAGRRRPRARWRTRLVSAPNLRFVRTTLLGRAPGYAPGPAPVGPWQPILLERRRRLAVDALDLTVRAGDQDDAFLSITAVLRPLDGGTITSVKAQATWRGGGTSAPLDLGTTGADGGVRVAGIVDLAAAPRWWPHTHGAPDLVDVRLAVGSGGEVATVECGRVGVRSLEASANGAAIDDAGVAITVNGEAVFARGAVWTPADFIGFAAPPAEVRSTLEAVAAAGMNMVRIPGIGAYETDDFHDACDDLGILLWQDLMFANLDYPFADEEFAATARAEASAVAARLAWRPSLAVVCGSSEIEQQAAMLGLDPAIARGEFFAATVPETFAAAGADAGYVPSAPCGGTLPFRTDRGVANYYGVGGYRRPLSDARLASVRFAAECLAFSNVPDDAALGDLAPDEPGALVVHHPRWKAGVPRDAGSGWDFEDVRDHYLAACYGVDPAELRRCDHGRYLDLSRAVTGELMAEVFGEWRRAASPCRGGLVLWLRDLRAGAGWGVLDHRGTPKAAWRHLARALAPVAVWMTDEGLNGIAVHVANDRPVPLEARLRIALYRDAEVRVDEAELDVAIGPNRGDQWDVEALIGRFADASYAYRFGPPPHDVVAATLAAPDGTMLSQAFRFPAGHPLAPVSADAAGAAAALVPGDPACVTVRGRRALLGVTVHAPGWIPDDNSFTVEPGGSRTVALRPGIGAEGRVTVTALNLEGRLVAHSDD